MSQTTTLMVGLLLGATAALAGPPLICHPFPAGNVTLLPWGSGTDNWNNPDPKYDTVNLAADTVRLLETDLPVMARMETLRRAAVYSGRNAQAGLELATRLLARALAAEVKGPANSLALFDAGYFAESMKQLSHITKSPTFAGIDGYDWARRSVPGLQDKVTAEYALALMASMSSWPNEHIRRAVAGAQEGTPLAQTILSHFPKQTLADLKRSMATRSASR